MVGAFPKVVSLQNLNFFFYDEWVESRFNSTDELFKRNSM